MLETFGELRDAVRGKRELAYCRLIETRGSTPQKAGALMLVHPDGRQTGTLGGGCVEAEVKRRALAAVTAGRPAVHLFQLNHDYGWDDGLICGGRMQVLVQPIEDDDAREYFGRLSDLVLTGKGATEVVTLAGAEVPPPEAMPQLLLFDGHGQLQAALNHAAVDRTAEARALLQPLAERPSPSAQNGLAFLPILPRCRLVIVGGGHVGKAVADLAAELDFDVWVVDDRAEFVAPERFPQAQRRIQGDVNEVLPHLEITPDTYCLIVTRGHHHDEEALLHLADRGARYVGLIGSKRKIKLIFEDLRAEGVAERALQQVFAPVGIDIGSQTVPEIAVSICAELIAHRNCQGRVPGRPASLAGSACSDGDKDPSP